MLLSHELSLTQNFVDRLDSWNQQPNIPENPWEDSLKEERGGFDSANPPTKGAGVADILAERINKLKEKEKQ